MSGVFKLGNPEEKGSSCSFRIQGERGVKKNVPSIMGVWIFSGKTQCRCTFIFSHRFSPPITVSFSVGEKRRLETDLHLQATRGCFLLEKINTKFS